MIGLINLDTKDRAILEILKNNPDISQNDIAKMVNLSQPSVGARIKKLKDSGIINHTYGIDLKNPGFYILKVDVKCNRPEELVKMFKGCPYFLNAFTVAGNYNLTILFVGEEVFSLQAIVDQHVRISPFVDDVEIGLMISAERSAVVPMRIKVKNSDKAPCNSDCRDCDYWKDKRCLGCPVTGFYRGKIWKDDAKPLERLKSVI